MSMVCRCCLPSAVHSITDAAGRKWCFEQNSMFGPLILRGDAEPAARQPGSRSAFWAAYDAWRGSLQVTHTETPR